MGRAVLSAGLLLASALLASACQRPPEATWRVQIRGASLRLLVADTEGEKLAGLQGIDIAEDEGMVFVWREPAVRAFAIKELDYPVDVVWVDGDRRVLGVSRLTPGDEDAVESPGAAEWVIETRAGWAERTGVEAGDAVVVAGPR